MVELQQVEARDRRLAHIDLEFLGLEHALARAGVPGRDEIVDHVLGFAEHLEIRLGVEVRNRGRVGTADGDRLAARAAQIDDLEQVVMLRQHAAGHDQIGPVEIAVGEVLDVAVDQPHLP